MRAVRPMVFAAVALGLLCGQVAAEQITDPDALMVLTSEVELAASEPGIVEKVHFTEGEAIVRGTPIISLNDAKIRREAKAAAQEAEIALLASENDVDARFAEKSKAVAEAELSRAKLAVELSEKSVSKSELDQLRLQAERAELAEEQAKRDLEVAVLRAELEQSRAEISAVRMDDMKIKVPFDGVVVEIFKHAGEWVSVGEPVARVIQLDPLRVEALVDGLQYDLSLQGQPASITAKLPAGEERTFTGKVSFVSPEIDPDNGLMVVWAEIENPDLLLRPGMRGELRIGHE